MGLFNPFTINNLSMNNIVNTHLYLKDRKLLQKNYIDLKISTLLPQHVTPSNYSTRPYMPMQKFKSLPKHSHRSLKSSKKFDSTDFNDSELKKFSYSHSTKSSIISISHTRTCFKAQNTQQRILFPASNPQVDQTSYHSSPIKTNPLTPRGLQGYNFSILNKNRNLVKSKFLRQLI